MSTQQDQNGQKNKSVDMQDHRPGDIVCAKCSRVIVPQMKAEGMRQRTIDQFVEDHKCIESMEAKRDFESEVR